MAARPLWYLGTANTRGRPPSGARRSGRPVGGSMRLCLRLMGLDVFDLSVDTDGPAGEYEAGESTTYPVGFSIHEGEYVLPDRSLE